MKRCGSQYRGKNRYTRDELISIAKQKNIPGYRKMNMDELCSKLNFVGASPRLNKTLSPRKKCGKQYKPKERYTLSELKNMAKNLNIRGYSKLNMDELCSKLNLTSGKTSGRKSGRKTSGRKSGGRKSGRKTSPLPTGSKKILIEILRKDNGLNTALDYLSTHSFPDINRWSDIVYLLNNKKANKSKKEVFIKILVDRGINISLFFDLSPEYWSDELIEMALANGLNPDVTDRNKYSSPLIKAIAYDTYTRMNIVKSLLKYGADPNKHNPIEMVYTNNIPVETQKKLISLLIKSGADPNTIVYNHSYNHNFSLLTILITFDMIQDAIYILNEGADPNGINGDPLRMAIYNRNYYIAIILLNRGADPNINPDSYVLPLNLAIQKNDIRMVELLLDKDANPNILGKYTGMYPIHTVFQTTSEYGYYDFNYKNLDMLKLLLEYGADINVVDSSGNSIEYYITRNVHTSNLYNKVMNILNEYKNKN